MKSALIYILLAFSAISTFIGNHFVDSSAFDADVLGMAVDSEKIKGLSFVAPSRPFSSNPMPAIADVNASWLAVIPYGFIPGDENQVYHGSERQWWGEREEGVIETIKLAHAQGLKVMLKPQIWMHGAWIGDFEANNEADWKAFEKSYSQYLLLYARIAQKHGVEMLCIGTELKKAMQVRTNYFYHLIDEVREVYDGSLTYSSNWDEYMDVPVWDKLDFIGISAYFPLIESKNPTHSALQESWEPIVKALERFSKKKEKPILFTEFGYLSLDGCAGKTWILEKERERHEANHEAQATAIHCLFDAFWDKDWWAGGFIWKWYPEITERRKRHLEKDYSPQGKIAEKTLTEWYKKK